MVLSLFGNLIGDLFGNDSKRYRDDDTISPCFRPGILLDFGISWIKFFRKFLVAGMTVGAVTNQSTKCDQVCRASELPIYINEEEYILKKQTEICPTKPHALESVFGSVRRSFMSIFDQYTMRRKEAEEKLEECTHYATSTYKYLSEESDEKTRMGAVGVGAVAGFILGMRGGIIKRLFYSSIGAYGMCFVCYPKQTQEYTQQAVKQAKMYVNIGYNFMYGVKKDDVQLPQLPKFPSSIGEVWELAGDLGKSASSLITGKKQEAIAATKETDTPKEQPTEVQTPEVIQKAHENTKCTCPDPTCLGRLEN